MGDTFLGSVAQKLYAKYGDQISNINVVFPSKRARIFFERELSEVIKKPIWQPNYVTIDDVVKQFSQIELGDNLKLVATLYKIYTEVTKEDITFDKFYGFGEIMLSDFDTIDKYLVSPKKIFKNISDIGIIDDIFEVNNEEIEIIENFWKNYNGSKGEYTKRFSKIWQHLDEIYHKFNAELNSLKIGYSGKIYRQALRNISKVDIDNLPSYVFVGFNALNSCEKTLFKFFQNKDKAIFFWDCDKYYLNNTEQEAGLFLRRNIKLFGDGEVAPIKTFKENKNIEIVKVPSEILQAKALYDYLDKNEIDPSQTAVILTNENLLPVVLSFIPDRIEHLNITMGGKVTHSVVYVLFERIIRAQQRRQGELYNIADITDIHNHELIRQVFECPTQDIEKVKSEGGIYTKWDHLNDIFTTNTFTGNNIGQYLLDVVTKYCFSDTKSQYDKENNEYATLISESIEKLNNIVNNNDIDISVKIYLNLLNRLVNQARIAYIGEPLNGMQVMGILESRCIDFKNVFILSVTDSTFPSSRIANSFIPPTLKKGYGLPTQTEHAAVWAYYFYRLIQRAKNVTLMYAATTEKMGVSEPSRYIYQLEYESGHDIKHISLNLNVNKQIAAEKLEEPKDIKILENLKFSPSKINDYIDCPLKFAYKHIKEIFIPKPIDQLSSADSGNILHKSLEIIYNSCKVSTINQLRTYSDQQIWEAINDATIKVLDKRLDLPTVANSIKMIQKLVFKYIRLIIDFDIKEGLISSIYKTEGKLDSDFQTNNGVVKLLGYADRIDLLTDNSKRIIDYKSGQDKQVFDNVESLFIPSKNRNRAALQTLIYALMSNSKVGIYNVKNMQDPKFSPYLKCKQESDENILIDQVGTNLKLVFDEIFSNQPYCQTSIIENCQYCDYNSLCRRSIDTN